MKFCHCDNIDGLTGCYAKWGKLGREIEMLYDFYLCVEYKQTQ